MPKNKTRKSPKDLFDFSDTESCLFQATIGTGKTFMIKEGPTRKTLTDPKKPAKVAKESEAKREALIGKEKGIGAAPVD